MDLWAIASSPHCPQRAPLARVAGSGNGSSAMGDADSLVARVAIKKPPAFGRGRAAWSFLGVTAIGQNQTDKQAPKSELKLRRQLGDVLTAAAEAGFRVTCSLEKIAPPLSDNNKNEWDEVLSK